MPGKRMRAVELALLLSVAYLPGLLGALLVAPGRPSPGAAGLAVVLTVVHELTYLALLAYVVFRQGRRLADLGLSLAWRDVPRFLTVLVIAAGAAAIVAGVCLLFFPPSVFSRPGTLWYAVPAVVAPFFNQTFYQGFVLSELEYLTGRTWLAVAGSVLLEVSLARPSPLTLVEAAVILVFALYYVRCRRVMPLILAALVLNLVFALA